VELRSAEREIMVVSETIAAIVISVLGLRRSYRLALRAESRMRKITRQPVSFPEGYNTISRTFLRKVFKVGLAITLRIEAWRGRLKPKSTRAPPQTLSNMAKVEEKEARAESARARPTAMEQAKKHTERGRRSMHSFSAALGRMYKPRPSVYERLR